MQEEKSGGEKEEEKEMAYKCLFCSGYEEKADSVGEDPIFKEVAEREKHEIIAKVAQYIGEDPTALAKAEKLFEELKYLIARYVLRYEFNKTYKLSLSVALWLDHKCFSSGTTSSPLEEFLKNLLG